MGLTAESLACRRGNRLLFTALGFHLAPGEFLILRGANGAGKTSLLRLLAGLSRPAAGQVLWNGLRISQDPESYYRQLHYLGHLDGLKSTLTVIENLHYAARLRGQIAISSVLDRLDIAQLATLPVRLLSAGQRRRVALARLLTSPVPLWLLDEPSAALDRDSTQLLDHALTDHCRNGGIAVIASHENMVHPLAKIIDITPLQGGTA